MKRLVYLLLGLFLHLSASVTTAAAPATETAGQVLARLYKRWHLKLVEKEPFLVDVDFIGPILDQSGKRIQSDLLGTLVLDLNESVSSSLIAHGFVPQFQT